MSKTQLITGYYRFTDIFWEWHTVLPNPEDIGPLKALISPEALVHPDHPLHKPGTEGIELFRGVFENGEARLMYSSAQVEYMRYYLHAMKLTAEPIPLPSSDYLIRKADLKSCVPDYYTRGQDIKKAMKAIDKINKRLRGLGGNTSLASRRLDFERVRSYWTAKAGTWLAIDFEAWEREHTLLLEFGWSQVRWDTDGDEVDETGHLIIKERMQYQNTEYVKGNRDRYNFGQSEQVSRSGFKERVVKLINDARERGPLFLIFHDSTQDIRDLTSEQVAGPLPGISYILPDATPSTGIFVVDTVDLFAALEGSSGGNKRGLEQTCRQLQVPSIQNLHNAGNDAHYTMLALRAMAEGGAIDAQRKERWPAFITATGLSADLPGFDGNPDLEELEGPNAQNIIEEPSMDVDNEPMQTE